MVEDRIPRVVEGGARADCGSSSSSSTSRTVAAGSLGGGIGGLSALQRRTKRSEEELLVLQPEELALIAEAFILPNAASLDGGTMPVLSASSKVEVHGATSTDASVWRWEVPVAYGSAREWSWEWSWRLGRPWQFRAERDSHRAARRCADMAERKSGAGR